MELALHLYAHFSHRIQNGRQALCGHALVLAGIAALTGGHDLTVERGQRQVAHNVTGLFLNIGQLGRKTCLSAYKGNVHLLGEPAGKGALRGPQYMSLPRLAFVPLIAF